MSFKYMDRSKYMDELDMIEHIENNFEREYCLTKYFKKMDEIQDRYWKAQIDDMIKCSKYNRLYDYELSDYELIFDNVFDNKTAFHIIVKYENKYKFEMRITISFTENCPIIIKHGLIDYYVKNNVLNQYPSEAFNSMFEKKYHQYVKSVFVNNPTVIFQFNSNNEIDKIFKLLDTHFHLYIDEGMLPRVQSF